MRHRAALVVACLALALLLTPPGVAMSQTPAVRLAAPGDCMRNPTCGVGLRTVYGLGVGRVLVPLTVADAGVAALDDGLAEVAVAFTSSPSVSRPDVLVLRDDRHMLKPDHVVPVVRSSVLRAYGPRAARDIRERLDTASALISTRVLRSLNQQVGDGRLPEAVGGEFIDANGLGGDGRLRDGPRIVIGYQAFSENETLAHLYAEALHAGGYRIAVRPVGGLRDPALRALRAGRIGAYPDYARSLLGRLERRAETRAAIGGALTAALERLGAQRLRFAPGENRNVFVMKRDVAQRLGVTKVSDLVRYWGVQRNPA
jgi:glycine betaine/choline ABC-type transport system substrate-binding protein